MRYIITIVAMITWCICHVSAQFSITNTGGYTQISGSEMPIDAVIVFNGIDVSSKIKYTGSANIEWQWTVDNQTYSSNQKEINPDHSTLYNIYENGKRIHSVYSIDYSQNPIVYNALTVSEPEEIKCESIELYPEITVSDFTYTDSLGSTHLLPRRFTVEWHDAVWNGTEWTDTIRKQTSVIANRPTAVPAPLKNTTFRLYEEEYSSVFDLVSDTLSADYTAIASCNHLQSAIIEREFLNEKDRSSQSSIEGSGPLNVEFTSNANPLDVTYYEWIVTFVENPSNYKRYNDKDLNFFFEDTGEYSVKLTTSSGYCQYSDSVNIRVLESYLEAPNIFTPNGDGMNDEWRVAYRSITSYQCIVQNRWGRTVFKSDNPGRGWDGRINGRPAAEGTYYYVIVAYGSDLDKKGKPVKYKLSGDINLLR